MMVKACDTLPVIQEHMSVTNIFELEMINFDLNLFYMDNSKLKEKIVESFKTLVNNCENNPYCRYGAEHTAR